MEYTNDIILKVKYKGDEANCRKHKIIKELVKKIKDDEYFTLTMIVSVIALSIDFFIVKRFLEIINL